MGSDLVRAGVAALSIVMLLSAQAWAAQHHRRSHHASEKPAKESRVLDAQIRLARANASPGPIDGKSGKNMQFAVSAYQRMKGLEPTGRLDAQLARMLSEEDNAPTLVTYTISEKDVAGPFIGEVPATLEEKAKLDRLGYSDATELLAEKFHTSRELLARLNPGAALDRAGTQIQVANVASVAISGEVKRIEVDKRAGAVWAYDGKDQLIAAYPATIGSEETPSPSGQHKVVSVARNPTYTYDPSKLNFKDVQAREKLTIAPGPNNPVGLVWIALDAPSYGIHGSPEPDRIRRQGSHGCVRLTNWDALALAAAVKKGVPVDFIDAQAAAASR